MCSFLGIATITILGNTLLQTADANNQMIRIVSAAAKAVQADGFVEYTPELAVLNQQMALRESRNSGHTAPVMVTLSLWANDVLQAQRWLQTSPVAQKRVMDSRFGWRTVSLIPLGMRPWTYSQQMIVDMAWLAGLRLAAEGAHTQALQWFQRGLSLSPGRVPEDVRRAYYRTLSEWYQAQPVTPRNSRLAAKFACLANGPSDCSKLIMAESPVQDLSGWVAPISDTDAVLSNDGWQLMGFYLDEDILAAGVDVAGLAYWMQGDHGVVQTQRRVFVVPNLAPNPGFEFQGLFNDACVDGYIGSHAFVLPCVSQIEPDPLGQRAGHVAVTQTGKTGYLLIGAPANVKGEEVYIVGAELCSVAGSEAKVGIQFASNKTAQQNAYLGLWWPLVGAGTESPACWSKSARAVLAPPEIATVRMWLGGFGVLDVSREEAMFDNVFLFRLPDFLQSAGQ